MQLFKATIKLLSPLATVLKGDTIWGHIVWGIANHEGDEAVDKFLSEEKSDEPPLIVSSAFPKDTICKPYPPHFERKEKLSTEEYAQIKKSKKVKFVPASEAFENEKNISSSGFGFEKVSSMHNSINRFSGTVEGSNLFASTEMWAENPCFDIYALSSYKKERVEQLLVWAFENGFGADSSTGKGKIVLEKISETKPKNHTGKYVALAPFVLDDIVSSIKKDSLCADIFVRTGKIGGTFSSFMSPYKKTVLMFDEGSVFESDKPLQFVGKLLTDVHSDKRICQSGFAPVVPVAMENEK